MDKKATTHKELNAAPKGRVSMTDLVGATKQATHPTQTKTKATPSRAVAGRKARELRPDDKVINVSLSLRESEYSELQAYADKRSASRGSLMTALIRHAMREMRAGRVDLRVESLKFVSPD